MPEDVQGATQGNQGTTPPEGPDLAAENEALKRELAEAREGRRADRAQMAQAKFGLDDATTELLKALPADEIETKAAEIAQARGTAGPSSQVGPNDPPPPTPDPATAAAMDVMAQGGGQPNAGDPPKSLVDQMAAEVAQATSLEEVTAIQNKWLAIAKEREDRTLFAHG